MLWDKATSDGGHTLMRTCYRSSRWGLREPRGLCQSRSGAGPSRGGGTLRRGDAGSVCDGGRGPHSSHGVLVRGSVGPGRRAWDCLREGRSWWTEVPTMGPSAQGQRSGAPEAAGSEDSGPLRPAHCPRRPGLRTCGRVALRPPALTASIGAGVHPRTWWGDRLWVPAPGEEGAPLSPGGRQMPEARVPEGSGHSPLWPAWEQWGWQPGGPGKTLGAEWALLRGLRLAPCCWNRVQIRPVGRTAGRRDGRTGGASVRRDRGPRVVHCEPWKDGAGAGSTSFTPSWATELAAGHRGVDSHGVPNRRAGRPARPEPWLRGHGGCPHPWNSLGEVGRAITAVWMTKQNPRQALRTRHEHEKVETRRESRCVFCLAVGRMCSSF